MKLRGQRMIPSPCPLPEERVSEFGNRASDLIRNSGFGFRASQGFTLVELMVVMVIIAVLASISIPAMKGLGQANRSSSAHRQILDDLAYARLKAINDRAPVYMVFAPANTLQAFPFATTIPERRRLTNVLGGAFSSYAIVSTRTIGDQPGRPTPRYLSEWKSLPEGMIFAPYKLLGGSTNVANEYTRAFSGQYLPFPSSKSARFYLPCIGFNSQGQLISGKDEIVTLAKGSVFMVRNKNGTIAMQPPDVQLNPPVNAAMPPQSQTNTYQFVRVNWLTGRARVEIPEIAFNR